MTDFRLFPLNDLVLTLKLENVDAVTGLKAPVATGTVTGFLATSKASDAAAYTGAWSVNGVYVGGNNKGDGGTYDLGTWMFQIDAAVLTLALCEAAFGTAGVSPGRPYFIAQKTSDVRVAGIGSYKNYRRADAA